MKVACCPKLWKSLIAHLYVKLYNKIANIKALEFLLQIVPFMALATLRAKKLRLKKRQNFDVRTNRGDCEVSEFVFLMFTLFLLFNDFSTFRLFIVENCIYFGSFGYFSKIIACAGWAVSIRGNDFIAGCTGECLKSKISAESNMIFKNLVLQDLEIIRIRFRQKSNKKFRIKDPYNNLVRIRTS